jgi:hypothetical protein
MPDDKLPPDIRTAVTQAFQSSGGVNALVKWIKANARNRGAFYTNIVAKLIALPPVQQVNVNVDNSHDAANSAKFDQMIEAIVAQRVQYTIEQRAGITHQFIGGPDIDREIRENERRERQLREAMEAPIVIDAEVNPPGPVEPSRAVERDTCIIIDEPKKTTPNAEAARRAAQLTPAQAKAKAMEPLSPIKRAPIDPTSLRGANGVFLGHADMIDDGLSTTERFLLYRGHGRPP